MSGVQQSSAQRARRFGILLAIVLLAVTLLWLRDRPWQTPEGAPPQVTDPEQQVAALVAELVGADGSSLRARLTPLHADPARQAFEGDVLRERLDLGPGEPWRLTLEWRRPDRTAGSAVVGLGGGGGASGRFGPSGPARGEPLAVPALLPGSVPEPLSALGLGPVRIDDTAGEALVSVTPEEAGSARTPDPLRTLLAPPTGSLDRGQAVDWVLWGRPPGPEARLVGLLPPPGAPEAEAFGAATGLVGSLVFEPQQVPRRELVLPLARLERPAPAPHGKNRASSSSEQP